jgi:Family of unknown function (DUF6084)
MGVSGPTPTVSALDAPPQLSFAVASVEALTPSAVPTLRFTLRIGAAGAAIRSILLDVQLQIAATRRRYDPVEQERLADLFGTPERWGETLRSVPWTRVTLAVPPFEDSALVHLDVVCTYDFEVSSARYLAALADGDVPLELLFSGTVFHADADGRLRVSRISWEQEATCALPVRVWREAIDRHFPDSAWIRLDRASFDRLSAFRAQHALTSWEAVVDELLGAAR